MLSKLISISAISDNEKILENIEIHLNFTYPLDETEESTSPSWILNVCSPCLANVWVLTLIPPFQSERWPKDTKRFIWRYFHEHNLYSARKGNLAALNLFAKRLKRHLKIECSDDDDLLIQKRCLRQITSGPGKFRGYGFLEEVDGALRKTAQFEAAWRSRRQQWIAQIHHGDLTGVIELEGSVASAAEKGTSSKRVCLRPRPLSLFQLPTIVMPC
jgi:hypothetical protein